MKFDNINSAKIELVEAVVSEHKALREKNDQLQEKSIKKAFAINEYIKNNFDLREMKDLLDHKKPEVKIWIANLLLPIYEDVSLEILDDISKKNIPYCSYNAKMMYEQWIKNR